MREWKKNANTRKVYEDLYKSSDDDNENADKYISLIIKSTFTAKKERTTSNRIWVQSVLETIFDVNHLFTKIDTEVVSTWADSITDTEMVNID